MSDLKISQKENFNEGLIRVIRALTEEALSEIKNTDENGRHKAVHEARKAFKKARAAFRLVRDQTGKKFYKKQNIYYRDLGRDLSKIRDANSDIETLDKLVEQFNDQLPEKAFQKIYNELYNKRKALSLQKFDNEKILEKISTSLTEKLEEIKGWQLEVSSFKDIRPSLKRVYKRGYKGYQASKKSQDTEDIHDWRKRVKYLRYQLEMISRIWPQILLVMEDELHDVSDFTGMYHDCVELRESVEQLNIDAFKEVELLYSIAQRHEKNMMELAFYTARKFYYEQPDTFLQRLETYWNAHDEFILNKQITSARKLKY